MEVLFLKLNKQSSQLKAGYITSAGQISCFSFNPFQKAKWDLIFLHLSSPPWTIAQPHHRPSVSFPTSMKLDSLPLTGLLSGSTGWNHTSFNPFFLPRTRHSLLDPNQSRVKQALLLCEFHKDSHQMPQSIHSLRPSWPVCCVWHTQPPVTPWHHLRPWDLRI